MIFRAFEFVSAVGVFYRLTNSFVQDEPSRKADDIPLPGKDKGGSIVVEGRLYFF